MKTRLGQNFLFQPDWQRRVADAVPADADARLLEIGGGEGHLSAFLAERAGQLTIVELDERLAAGLRQRFSGDSRVHVVEGDVLGVSLEGFDRVAGNLPYYISAPILFHLYGAAATLRDATLMLQREVADRLVAQPGTPAFGRLSAMTQLYCRPTRLFDLPPGAFRPPPKVHSSLVRLEFSPRAAELGVAAEPFAGFLRQVFRFKRKRLSNNLAEWPRAALLEACSRAGVSAACRAEQLHLAQLAAVFRELQTPGA